MPMGRFLVPGIAFGAVLLGWLATAIRNRWHDRQVLVVLAMLATVGLGLLPAWNVHVVPSSMRRPFHFRYYGAGFRTEYDVWRDGVRRAARAKRAQIVWDEFFAELDSVLP